MADCAPCSPCREVPIFAIEEAVHEAYDAEKALEGGKNASYIPYLADADPDLFGICMTFGNGAQICVGDVDHIFGIESVSKVPTAILAMAQAGPDAVLDQIGANATGMPFNSITAILLEKR